MIVAIAQPPTPGQVVVGVLALIVGALVATASAYAARRTRNWLHHIGTAGGLLIVSGIAGQRTVAEGVSIGPWDAGISIPVIGVRIDPVLAAGIIVTLIGLTVVLLFERVPEPGEKRAPLVHRPLEDDDLV